MMPHTVIEQNEYFGRTLILMAAWEKIMLATQMHDMQRGM